MQVHAALWEAVRSELVERLPGVYRFVHDRVQEAAYSLIPEDVARRRPISGSGGCSWRRRLPRSAKRRSSRSSISSTAAPTLITSQEEREQLAELNLIAGKRAKASTAYASALTYFAAGAALLPEDCWERRRELIFALELNRAECEFLTGALAEAEARLAELARRAANLPDLAAVTRLRVELFHDADRIDRASRSASTTCAASASTGRRIRRKRMVRQEYAADVVAARDRPIEALLDLPLMADPVACGTMDVLTALVSPALHTDDNLRSLVIGRMANLSLEHGNSDCVVSRLRLASARCWAPTSATTRRRIALASSARLGRAARAGPLQGPRLPGLRTS